MLNGGGIRSAIPEGNVSYNDLITTIPFQNKYDRIVLKGSTLMEVFEHSVGRYEQGRPGEFLQVSGLEVCQELVTPQNDCLFSKKIFSIFFV